MALAISTVTNSIAALSVTGLTIKDLDEIPYTVNQRDCPIIYPEPINFLTDFDVVMASTGTAGSGYFDVSYTLTYTFCYQAVGADRGSLTKFSNMVQLLEDWWDKILISDHLTGAVEVTPVGIMNLGVVLDPAGYSFIGATVQLRVLEHE